MIWILVGIIAGFVALLAYAVWQKWIAPWSKIERVIEQIGRSEKPGTFLVGGGASPSRVGLALEKLLVRQLQLDRQIAESATDTAAIFAAMQDGFLVVDSKRRITLVNRTFQQLFDLPENPGGVSVLDLVRAVDLERLIDETLRSGTPQRGELTIPNLKTGHARRMQLSAVATMNKSGGTTGAVVLFHDITQLKQADEIRRDFVANVSHELRTPLSILKGYIETLLDDPGTSRDELVRILEVMNRHSNRLGSLVEDLLTLAQLESINPNLQWSDVRISELFASIVRDWGKKFAEKELSFDVGLEPNLPVIRADEGRLQEVLYNLLDNALKYSPPGGKIRLEARQRDNQMVLAVADSGVGISKADLPRIFERFYRADKGRSRELGGTGLGLSIVKHIAQMHGGNAEAESVSGKGTTIRVLLPLNGAAESATVTES